MFPSSLLSVSPKSRPAVSGLQPHYKPGDTVNISCLCPSSFPAANISWFINGNKVSRSLAPQLLTTLHCHCQASAPAVRKSSVITERTGLLSSYSVLVIPARNKLIIKCVASILVSH